MSKQAWLTIVLTSIVVCTSSESLMLAQGRMIALDPSGVQPGQVVRVKITTCATTPTVLVDGKDFPSKLDSGDLVLTTTSLAVGTHAVTTKCGADVSDPAALSILPVTPQPPIPTVVCARNESPRDGMAAPLTETADQTEEDRIKPVKEKAEKDNKVYPTTEEWNLLLARCDPAWAWTFRMEDSLSLVVSGLPEWQAFGDNKNKPLHLFIDGVELPNMSFRSVERTASPSEETVRTILTFETSLTSSEGLAANRKAWAELLRTARSKAWKTRTSWREVRVQDMDVSIGPAQGPQWPTKAKLRLNTYPTLLTIFGAAGVLALAVLLLYLALKTPLLRDDGVGTAPFSLAKNQMAFWFVVIFASYLFLWVTTGQAAALSATALILLGISGATGLAAIAIDKRKDAVEGDERRKLEAELATLTTELEATDGLLAQRAVVGDGTAEGQRLDALIQPKVQRQAAIKTELAKKQSAKATATSKGWLTDILSDEHGISVHRLQMAAWTFAMIGIFLVAVWREFAMPDFDTMTLGLLGISSGTYLGFKFPEGR